jgi:hypothetical protein
MILSIITFFGMMTLSVMTLSIVTLSIMTLSIMTLSTMALGIMTITWHYNEDIIHKWHLTSSASMMSVIYADCHVFTVLLNLTMLDLYMLNILNILTVVMLNLVISIPRVSVSANSYSPKWYILMFYVYVGDYPCLIAIWAIEIRLQCTEKAILNCHRCLFCNNLLIDIYICFMSMLVTQLPLFKGLFTRTISECDFAVS